MELRARWNRVILISKNATPEMFGKSINDFGSMLVYTPDKIAGHADL
jgi:hypothetical protein